MVLTGALLYRHRMSVTEHGQMRLDHAAVTLILVAGFMLGVVMSHLTRNGRPALC